MKQGVIGWLFLLVMSVMYYFSNMQKVLVPGATFNELQQIFAIDASLVTRLGSAFMYAYALMQLVTGPLADRLGGGKVILLGGVLFCAGCVTSAWAGSLGILYAGRTMTGLGAATIYLSCMKEISGRLPNSFAIFAGLLTIIGYSGAITGTTPFIMGVAKFGYASMMKAAAIGVIAVYALYALTYGLLPKKDKAPATKFSFGAYKAMFTIPNNYRLAFTQCFTFGTYFAIQTVIGKKYLEDFCGMSKFGAGNVLFAMMIIAALNGFLVALLSKCIGNRKVCFIRAGGLGAVIAATLLLCAAIFRIRTPWVSITAMIIMAFACNVSSMSSALFRENNLPSQFGTVLSVSNFLAYLVTAVFGGCMGFMMDLFPANMVNGVKIYDPKSYTLIFAVLLVQGLVAAVLSHLIREKRPLQN